MKLSEKVGRRVIRWDRSEDPPSTPPQRRISYSKELQRIEFFSNTLYCHYKPSLGTMFMDRLGLWLDGVPEDDQKHLLRLVPKIFFLGPDGQDALCPAAFRGPIIRWLIDNANIDLLRSDIDNAIAAELSATWFCGITDSAPINSFLKLNHLSGQLDPLPWKALVELLEGETDKLLEHIVNREHPIRYIVLLEDFVGSGLQMKPVLKFCKLIPDHIKILIVPLVCGLGGQKVGSSFAKTKVNIDFAPIIPLKETNGIKQLPVPGEGSLAPEIRRIATTLRGNCLVLATPFGFDNDGPLYISFTNSPNNALPLLHEDRGTGWQPLFPRTSRS